MVVRQTAGSNGLEAYRALIQQNEPLSKNRSMGLLNVIMIWTPRLLQNTEASMAKAYSMFALSTLAW